MKLKFLGSGSMFNPKLGNTSAYIKSNRILFLIDCGGTVFKELISRNLLDNVDTINVYITHIHNDHIGSLIDLITYFRYMIYNPYMEKIEEDLKNESPLDHGKSLIIHTADEKTRDYIIGLTDIYGLSKGGGIGLFPIPLIFFRIS